MEKAYQGISLFFVAILGVIILGFFRTYFGLFPTFEGLPSLVHFHALSILLWFALLIAQPILIKTKQVALHRKLGRMSYWLVGLVVVFNLLMTGMSYLKGSFNKIEPNIFGSFKIIGIVDTIIFVTFYCLAIANKNKPAIHARYMILTVLPFLNPSLGRLNMPGPVVGVLILIGLFVLERFNKKLYAPYQIGAAIYVPLYAVAMWDFLH
jgi:uncharacterized membrane protein